MFHFVGSTRLPPRLRAVPRPPVIDQNRRCQPPYSSCRLDAVTGFLRNAVGCALLLHILLVCILRGIERRLHVRRVTRSARDPGRDGLSGILFVALHRKSCRLRRIVSLVQFIGGVRIVVEVDRGTDISRSRHRFQRLHQLCRHLLFARLQSRIGPAASQQTASCRIHQDHVFRTQTVHGAGHQVGHSLCLVARERAMSQPQYHRSLGLPLIAGKQRIVRQHKVHARRLHRGQRGDGVLQFPLERPLVIHLLIELRAHPVRIVEQLKPHPPALRASFGRRRQPRLVQGLCRHAHRRAVRRDIELDSRCGQLLRDLARVVRIQTRIQRPPVRPRRIPQKPAKAGHHDRDGREQPVPSCRVEIAEARRCLGSQHSGSLLHRQSGLRFLSFVGHPLSPA